MKRLLTALFLLLCFVPAALAEITITQQPETQTVEAGGSLTFTVKAEGVTSKTAVTWYFTDPDTGEVTTGRKLSSKVKGLTVKGPNSLSVTLQKIPADMNGWTLYCHIGKKGAGVDSNEARILIAGYGGEDAEAPEEAGGDGAGESDGETSAAPDGEEEADTAESPETGEEPEETAEPETAGEAAESETAGEAAEEQDGGAETPAESQPAAAARTSDGNSCPQIRGFDHTVSTDYEKP